ncbi:MAG: trimethylamine methyltransferase family protein [Luminiphilus sp.]|jgi:trimethylamine---corrinoid protein Co-methyltransferase|nr:trimethylamine methyltransferase family protein [Luminiphilus sp.]
MSERANRRKGGGRAGRREARASSNIVAAPFIERNIPYFEILSEENLQLIEQNADRLLTEIGIDFLDDPEVLELFREAGADVDGTRVRFPTGLCRSIIQASAPSEYVQHARKPSRSVTIGGKRTVLVPAYGPPFVHDLDKGRRYATIEDFRNFVKLAYMAPGIHHSGGTVCEPVDLPVNKRHYDMVYSHFKYSDKPLMGSVTHWRRAQDSIDMAKIVFGDEFVDQNCVLTSLINVNSPLVFDGTMLGSLKVYARNNQATVVSPFILSGAMSPVTVTGTVTQILAEAMAGIALTQLIRPGCPVVFGTFAAAVSMATGAPTFGTPEPSMVIYAAAALARRLGVPFRSGGGLCGSKLPDAQAAYEAANTLQTAALAGVNFMLHTAGWLEGGLAMGYEKFIMDCDQASMIAVLLNGMDMSENGQAMGAFEEVGPGKHFLGSEHTLANFETAFYRSTVADNNSYEQWSSEGSLDTAQRANAIWKKMLAEYQAPELDPAIDEALLAFMTEQKASFADRDY